MAATVPAVEIANNADAARIRRPDREDDPRDAVNSLRMRPKQPMDLEMISFLKQIQLGFSRQQRELIGILKLDLRFADGSSQPIVETFSAIVERTGEEARGVELWQLADHTAVMGIDNPHPARPGYERTHHQGTLCAQCPMHAQHGERVAMFAADNSRYRSVVDAGHVGCRLLHSAYPAASIPARSHKSRWSAFLIPRAGMGSALP